MRFSPKKGRGVRARLDTPHDAVEDPPVFVAFLGRGQVV
jgi:hypothetical protein